jgi:hypothetical protein
MAKTLNGRMPKTDIQEFLYDTLTKGYKPTLPVESFWGPDGTFPFYMFRFDIERMIWHPHVKMSLSYYRSGIAGAEFEVKCEDKEIGEKFILEQVKKFWDRGVPLVQQGDEYGWMGCENKYVDDDGVMKWDSLKNFGPRDTFLLTQDSTPVGIRVKNIRDKGSVDLWLAGKNVPAKGLWYAHNPRHSQHYGQSQLMGAWRPWRRLAWKDGAETVLDGGIYRYAYSGIVIKYPEEDYQAPTPPPGTPNTTNDSQGNPRRYARDLARMIAEQYKAGAVTGFPSSMYPKEQGGGPKWDLQVPKQVLDVGPILEYVDSLRKEISYGIGVPPELLEASETGSGYSGRQIPMEAFLDSQQRIGDAMLQLFVEQVLRPLVAWNFGKVKFDVTMKRLLETKMKAKEGQPGGQQPGQQPFQQGQPNGQPKPPQGPEGWRGDNGRVHYGEFSLTITDRMRDMARRVIRKAA